QFDRLRLHRRAVGGQLLVHSLQTALQLIELFPAGRQIALPSPDVDLTFAGFPLLLGDLAILRREVLRELLHALRRSFELFALVIEAGVVGLVRFRLFGDFRALLGEFRLPALEFGQAPRERFLPFLDDSIARTFFCDSTSTSRVARRSSNRFRISPLASLTVCSSARRESSSRCRIALR